MALLLDAARREVWADFLKEKSALREPIAVITKQDLRDAINAVDQWVEDNKASYNSALPLAPRTNLTAAQKAELLLFVVRRRFREGA